MDVWIAVLATSAGCLLAAYVYFRHMRRRATTLGRAFRCKFIFVPEGDHSRQAYWPRRTSYAVWVHDVLVVFSGLGSTIVNPYAVHFAEGMFSSSQEKITGLGPSPLFMSLELDGGAMALLATSRASEELGAGPFLAALVRDDLRAN